MSTRWIFSSVHNIFPRGRKVTIKQTGKITTPGSLERTFDPGFGDFFEKAAEGEPMDIPISAEQERLWTRPGAAFSV